jgi:hypothetical protein
MRRSCFARTMAGSRASSGSTTLRSRSVPRSATFRSIFTRRIRHAPPGQTLSSAGSAVGDMGHEGIVTLCSVCLSSRVVLRHGLASCTGIAHVRRVPRFRPDTVVESDVPIGYRLGRRSGIGRLKVETPMRSGPVVVLGVRAEDALQVATTEDEDVVETLSSNGPDPSLGERVRSRHTDGCLHPRQSFRAEHFVERI